MPMKIKKEKNELIVFGRKPVEELIKSDAKNIEEIIFIHQKEGMSQEMKDMKKVAGERKIKVSFIEEKKAELMIGSVNSQGILAKIKKYQYKKYND
jgi:tRNA G18 (ribose-2'-O)-methylase SpoU